MGHALILRLGVSLLERFVGSSIAPIHLLNEQRRMHPTIAQFPNMQFYQGKIFSRGGSRMLRLLGITCSPAPKEFFRMISKSAAAAAFRAFLCTASPAIGV